MSKTLTPIADLMLQANNRITNGSNEKGHFRGRGGKEIADFESNKPFRDAGLHVCGSDQKVMEKLELMSEAIDFEDWMEFDDQAFKLKGLNPSDDHLNKFGREQIMKAVVENKPVLYLETLQRKLNSIGVTDDALNLAYDDGAKNRNRVSKASVIKSVPVNKWLPMVMSVGKRWIFKYMLKSPKINHLYPSPV